MDINKSKGRGRPATGRALDGVLFMRMPKDRVADGKAAIRKMLAGGDSEVKPAAPSEDIKALLDDIEAKDDLIGQLQGKISQLEVASEDEKFQALLAKYRELAAKVKANEADGSW